MVASFMYKIIQHYLHYLKTPFSISVNCTYTLSNPTICPSLYTTYPCSDVYPDGLPSDYSVIAVFKVSKDTAKTSWNLWQVSDPEGRDQVGLRFQGDTQTLDFFYTRPEGTQMLRTFQSVENLFDGEWHKLALSVKGEQVKLMVDCEEVSVEPLDEPRPAIQKGFTSIVKRAVGDRSVSVSGEILCYHFCMALVQLELTGQFNSL